MNTGTDLDQGDSLARKKTGTVKIDAENFGRVAYRFGVSITRARRNVAIL